MELNKLSHSVKQTQGQNCQECPGAELVEIKTGANTVTERWFNFSKYYSYIKWSASIIVVYACLLNPTSPILLEETERKILNYIKTPYKGLFVDIGRFHDEVDEIPKNISEQSYWFWKSSSSSSEKERMKIRTLVFNENSSNTPLVIIHGLCAAAGLWALNIDELAASRPVYAIDLLGFGRSSRPDFSTDAIEVEEQHVAAIEAWRKEMKLQNFVLLGHSMGGFLSTAYTLRYPERVAHLILADPWGFPQRPENIDEMYPAKRSFLVKVIIAIAQRVNPLGLVRAIGPFGPSLIGKLRSDLVRKYEGLNQNGNASIVEYIYHSNAQKPSGEEAFRTMMDLLAWAKHPMENRFQKLKPRLPVTIIYGEKSWVRQIPDQKIKQLRSEGDFLEIRRIEGAGHHVYADDVHAFNKIVSNVGVQTDQFLRKLL